MKSIAAVTLAMGASLVRGQVAMCDGYRQPNWDDCATVVADFAMEGSTEILHENGRDDPEPSCKFWYKDAGNCRITHCFQDTTIEPNEPRTRTGGEIFSLYDPIRSRCNGLRAGGEFTGNLEFVNVYNDEEQATGPTAAAPGKVVKRHDNGVVEGKASLEDVLEWLNDTRPPEEIRKPVLEGRQTGDDSVRIDFTAYGIRNPNSFDDRLRLGRGVGYEYSTSEGKTFGVTTSLNLGATWDIFTASAGIEMSQSETYTVTEKITFNVDCEVRGQVTFWPFYDFYEVTFLPSDTKGEIWVPVETGDKKINGEIAVACIG